MVVALNGHSYRSTVFTMGGGARVPCRRGHREAARIVEGQPVEITLTLASEPRTIEAPDDLRAALEAAGAWERWRKLAFTHRREHVEAVVGAKKPETRTRRIEKCVAMASARPAG